MCNFFMSNLQQLLKQYWGYDTFRPVQQEAMQSVMEGRDTLVLLPTGGGKSLCFQVPTLAMGGVCIVVTPLIALMKDQVEQLKRRHIPAAAIHSPPTARRPLSPGVVDAGAPWPQCDPIRQTGGSPRKLAPPPFPGSYAVGGARPCHPRHP